jgi:hypothetical protein
LSIRYTTDQVISPDEFVDVLRRLMLAERSAVDDAATIRGIIENSKRQTIIMPGLGLKGTIEPGYCQGAKS